jgi:hypothetical protein
MIYSDLIKVVTDPGLNTWFTNQANILANGGNRVNQIRNQLLLILQKTITHAAGQGQKYIIDAHNNDIAWVAHGGIWQLGFASPTGSQNFLADNGTNYRNIFLVACLMDNHTLSITERNQARQNLTNTLNKLHVGTPPVHQQQFYNIPAVKPVLSYDIFITQLQ